MGLEAKVTQAVRLVEDAGAIALDYFGRLDQISVEKKGHQDFVSQADRNVETSLRGALAKTFPDDAVVGEEHAPTPGNSGDTWVIDPIDGTTNFINAIPAWTVVLALVRDKQTVGGIIFDPCHGETYCATKGRGATLNGQVLKLPAGGTLRDGSVGVGFSNRTSAEGINCLVREIANAGGVFYRNASGALSLAYVAAGRLLGYAEEHMNAWDCLAGQLLVAEAGGCVEDQDADKMIADGGRVVVGASGVFEDLLHISAIAFKS